MFVLLGLGERGCKGVKEAWQRHTWAPSSKGSLHTKVALQDSRACSILARHQLRLLLPLLQPHGSRAVASARRPRQQPRARQAWASACTTGQRKAAWHRGCSEEKVHLMLQLRRGKWQRGLASHRRSPLLRSTCQVSFTLALLCTGCSTAGATRLHRCTSAVAVTASVLSGEQ